MLAALRDRLLGRVARWARKRQGPDAPPLTLRSRRLYILPTRAGIAFALLLLVMLVAGLNYTNSLGLLLTFMLAGFLLVGMHECQRTLQGLELLQAHAADCYAGSVGTLELRFANPARSARRALSLRCPGQSATHFDIDAGTQLTVQLAFHAARRGRQSLDRLELASTAPFGLFRCWTWLHLPVEVIVYPRPTGTRPLPPSAKGRISRQPVAGSPGEDEWAGLRDYQPGDSPRSINWKAWARGAPLMTSQYHGVSGSDHLLSFDDLMSLDVEARLSQLAAWIDECARLDSACALHLPGIEFPLGSGARHRSVLLRALALYEADRR